MHCIVITGVQLSFSLLCTLTHALSYVQTTCKKNGAP